MDTAKVKIEEKMYEESLLPYTKNDLIASIIIERDYSVPDDFIDEYVNDHVMAHILCRADVDLNTYPNACVLQRNVEIDKIKSFVAFILKAYERKAINLSSKYLLKYISAPIAIEVLTEDIQWKKYLSIIRKRLKKKIVKTEWDMWLFDRIGDFVSSGKDLPPQFVKEISKCEHFAYAYNWCITSSFHLIEKVVQGYDKLNILGDNIWLLKIYWEKGGTYFPNNIDSIFRFFSNYEDTVHPKSIMSMYPDNIRASGSGTVHVNYIIFSIAWYLFKHGKMKNTNNVRQYVMTYDKEFNSGMNEIVLAMFNKKIGEMNINNFWQLLRNVDSNQLSCIQKSVKSVIPNSFSVIMGYVESSKQPLRDFMLLSNLLPNNSIPVQYQLLFIKRGGDPSTIPDVFVNGELSVCYSAEGIHLILSKSLSRDVSKMLKNDKWIDRLYELYIQKEESFQIVIYEVRTLLSAIIKMGKITNHKLVDLARHCVSLVGMNFVILNNLSPIVGIIVESPQLRMDHRLIMQWVKEFPQLIQYIPIELLTKEILLKYMGISSGVISKLCVNSIKLDHVMDINMQAIYDIVCSKKCYGYIADMSDTCRMAVIDHIVQKNYSDFNMNL